eukprot:scaffold53956_cov66-Phaeocystis_antarctica.AAC.3
MEARKHGNTVASCCVGCCGAVWPHTLDGNCTRIGRAASPHHRITSPSFRRRSRRRSPRGSRPPSPKVRCPCWLPTLPVARDAPRPARTPGQG